MDTVKVGDITTINLAPESEAEDVKQCMAMICNTPRGSVPFMRGFGLSGEFMHSMEIGIENDIAEDVADQVEMYEKRIEMEDILFENGDTDRMEFSVPYTLVSEEEDDEY